MNLEKLLIVRSTVIRENVCHYYYYYYYYYYYIFIVGKMYRKMYYVYVDENHEIKISLVTVTVNLKTNQKVCGGL